MPSSIITLILTCCITLSSAVYAREDPNLDQRLERLSETLEEARLEAHVPGMSIAIVKDDQIIWTQGFGLSDLQAKTPADQHTIYGIGSTTKAFTATLIGMLVDEGKASWDDPVTKYLPFFDLELQTSDENAQCTLRDLLSHRHGFARMGLLWFSGQISRDEILRTAVNAKPIDEFRAGFHYCNITYLAAGEAAGIAAGSSWDELMVSRIFEPLGMNSSTIKVFNPDDDPAIARGYDWNQFAKQSETVPILDMNGIAPAGGVNSNVLDVAQWIRMQLAKGEFDGKRIVSSQSIQDTWDHHIEIGNNISYGLGWMLREVDGRQVIEHGGNVPGFSAQVSLMPEENLGYVLLMNQGASPLREASINIVFDALLDEWASDDIPDQNAPVNYDDYTGTFIANFAKFSDEPFEIQQTDDGIQLDIPSQRTFVLNHPDKNGKWFFEISDQIALSFKRNPQGEVVGLVMHQNNFNFDVPKKGHEITVVPPKHGFDSYLGTYTLDQGKKQLKIVNHRGRLAMIDKGTVLEFNTPGSDGHASLRARKDWGATFNADAEGNIESLTFHGGAGDRLFNRHTKTTSTKLATIEEINALRDTSVRAAALEDAGGIKMTGSIWVPQAGLSGTITTYMKGKSYYAEHMKFGKYGRADLVTQPTRAWYNDSLRGLRQLQGEELAASMLKVQNAIDGDWNDHFDSVEVVGTDTINDRAVHVIRLKKGDLPSVTYRVDAENGNVLRVNRIEQRASTSAQLTYHFSEFKELNGVRTPMRTAITIPGSGDTIITFEQIETGLDLGKEVFTLTSFNLIE